MQTISSVSLCQEGALEGGCKEPRETRSTAFCPLSGPQGPCPHPRWRFSLGQQRAPVCSFPTLAEQASQSSGHQGPQRQVASAPLCSREFLPFVPLELGTGATPCHASSRTPERRVHKLFPQARSIHLSDFINKLLLEHSHAQLLTTVYDCFPYN